ncbi:hypothetical protein A3F66_00165 [candidate division TM6 bacterium RIFCSPHIGHO2_12_FULL_32_22]|nr:MAG: hypothetical protein A3F66_00165 [candidate division TM6 bacterium RIFCSPHIGHO2_12_FULL_32_22]
MKKLLISTLFLTVFIANADDSKKGKDRDILELYTSADSDIAKASNKQYERFKKSKAGSQFIKEHNFIPNYVLFDSKQFVPDSEANNNLKIRIFENYIKFCWGKDIDKCA